MDRAEPTNVEQARNAFGIPAISLDGHGLQGALHLPRFHQNSIQPGIRQPTMQPLRQGASLKAQGRYVAVQSLQPRKQRLRFAGDLSFPNDLSMLAAYADRRLGQ